MRIVAFSAYRIAFLIKEAAVSVANALIVIVLTEIDHGIIKATN